MPCSDVTESIAVTLDGENRLLEYALAKRTCGRGVGAQDLLLEDFRGMPVDEILAVDQDDFQMQYAFDDEVVEFLHLKHLVALQQVLAMAIGAEGGAKDDVCTIASIDFDGDAMSIEADIAIEVAVRRIRSCGAREGGSCGCGS